MKSNTLKSAQCLTASGIAAALFAGSPAHATVIVENTGNETVSSGDEIFFDIEATSPNQTVTFSTSEDSNEFAVYPGAETATSKLLTDQTYAGITTSSVAPGSTVGPDSSFDTATYIISETVPSDEDLSNGDQYFGLELTNQPKGTDYGYIKINQTGTVGDYTDIIESIGYDTVAGDPITVAPEPRVGSLLATAAAGAVGLLAFRRLRRHSAAL
jgi:hypothetical protein